MRECKFTVPGQPIPKGSMVGFVPEGTRRAYLTASNRKALKPWEARITSAAIAAWDGEPSAGPIMVSLVFRFARPKSHYGTGRNAGVLKLSAPTYPIGSRNDIDKLERAMLDGLTGVVFGDDGQVVRVTTDKLYGRPGVDVRVYELIT